MATELGTAYLQIMPSARGMKGSLTNIMSGEAGAAGDSAGSSFSSRMKGRISKAAIGATVAAGLKKSISEGAALEQSIGGIETLFKSSSDKMLKYASQAYKTAGLSANSYMEQVTSFSASLLQATGGNTQKAADAANQAVIDMSDNANKMGSNIQDIQNAYQGFAKQNYTMLDNLKLGYGGTKTEMERLLADAQKITGVKYDISNLNDVYSAIHVIQGELGITGTTAKEAASTISGSMASMGAAWDNFMGNLMLGRDIGPSMKALVDSAAIFLFDNLIPAIGNIITSIPQAVGPAIKGVFAQLTGYISETFNISPIFSKMLVGVAGFVAAIGPVTAAIGGIGAKVGGVISSIGKLGKAFSFLTSPVGLVVAGIAAAVAAFVIAYQKSETFRNTVNKLVNALGSALKPIIEAVMQTVKELAPVFTEIITSVGSIISTLASSLVPIIKSLLPVIRSIITVVGNIAKTVIPILVAAIRTIAPIIQTMVRVVTPIIKTLAKVFSTVFNAIAKIVEPIFKAIATFIVGPIKAVIKILSPIITAIKAFFKFTGLGDKVSKIFGKIGKFMSDPIGTAKDAIKGIINKIKGWFPFNIGKIIKFKLPNIFKRTGKEKGTFAFGASWSNHAVGGVFTKPTLLESNNGALHRVGESGAEAILPLSTLWRQMDSRIGGQSNSVNITNHFTINNADDAEAVAKAITNRLSLQMRSV